MSNVVAIKGPSARAIRESLERDSSLESKGAREALSIDGAAQTVEIARLTLVSQNAAKLGIAMSVSEAKLLQQASQNLRASLTMLGLATATQKPRRRQLADVVAELEERK